MGPGDRINSLAADAQHLSNLSCSDEVGLRHICDRSVVD